MKKNLSILLVIVALALTAGCGKKKTEKAVKGKKEVAQANLELAQKDIPVVNDAEEFLDDSDVSDFAFADNDEFTKDNSDLFETVPAKDNKKVAEAEFFGADDTAAFDENNKAPFKTVLFDLNKNDIRVDQKSAVDEDVQRAKEVATGEKKVVVLGHCCQLGSPSYNLPLSERRARAIKDEMIKKGVPEENIKTVGMGQEMPLVWSDSKDKKSLIKELAPNRRAEIQVN